MPDEVTRLTKYLETYAEFRRRVTRNAFYCSVASVILALLSRTPEVALKPPRVGDVDLQMNLHIGYIVVFGPPVILVLFCAFFASFCQLVAFRNSILEAKSFGKRDCREFEFVEEVLLQLPFQITRMAQERWSCWFATLGTYIGVFGAPLISYFFLMMGYFQLTKPGFTGNPYLHLLFGTGGWGGFRPDFSFLGEHGMPWIYVPFQTWLYILGFALLVWLAIASIRIIRRGDTHLISSIAVSKIGDTL